MIDYDKPTEYSINWKYYKAEDIKNYIDKLSNWLKVFEGNAEKCEEILALIRKASMELNDLEW